jgi:hypothetical protein
MLPFASIVDLAAESKLSVRRFAVSANVPSAASKISPDSTAKPAPFTVLTPPAIQMLPSGSRWTCAPERSVTSEPVGENSPVAGS